jgi:hypothetical protein
MTLTPMDTRKLYFLPIDQLRPLELLPFFRLMTGPITKQEACYFYSRFNGGNVRWVSYHFEGENEINLPDANLEATLDLLKPDPMASAS